MTKHWPSILLAILCFLLAVATSAFAEGAVAVGQVSPQPAQPR